MSSGFGVGPSGGKNGYGQPIDQFRDEEFSGFRPTKRQSRGASIAQRISYFAADDNRMPKLFRILCCFIVLLIVLVILGFLLAKFVVFTKSKQDSSKNIDAVIITTTIKSTAAENDQMRHITLPQFESKHRMISQPKILKWSDKNMKIDIVSLPPLTTSPENKRDLNFVQTTATNFDGPDRGNRFVPVKIEPTTSTVGSRVISTVVPDYTNDGEERSTLGKDEIALFQSSTGKIIPNDTTRSDIIQTETMPQPLPQNDVTLPTVSKIVDSKVSSEKLRHLPAVNSNIYPTATSEFTDANLNLVPSTTDHFTFKKKNVNSIENQLAKDVSGFTELSHTISVGDMTEKNSSSDAKRIDVIETMKYSSSEKEDKICETRWTSWSDCVADNLCGSGHRNRSRIDPKCEQIITSEGCSAEPCLKISDVKAGSPMSFCTKTCGGGSMLRRAACLQMDLEAALTNQKKRSLQAKVGATKYLEVDKKVCLINGIASDEDFQTSQESCCEHRCDNTKGSIFGVLSNGALTMKYTGDDSKNDPYEKQRSQFFCVNHLAVIDVGLPELADYFCNQVGYNLSYNKRSLKFVADKPVPTECSCVGGFIDVLIYKNQKSGNKTQQFDIAWTTALRFGAAHQFVTLQC